MSVNSEQPRNGRNLEIIHEGKGYEANQLLDPKNFNELFKDDQDD